MATVHPVAVVLDQRPTSGAVVILDVLCPFGDHVHTIGLAEPTAVLWCSHTGRHYRVTLPREDQP